MPINLLSIDLLNNFQAREKISYTGYDCELL